MNDTYHISYEKLRKLLIVKHRMKKRPSESIAALVQRHYKDG